jgi:hypothetical protein
MIKKIINAEIKKSGDDLVIISKKKGTFDDFYDGDVVNISVNLVRPFDCLSAKEFAKFIGWTYASFRQFKYVGKKQLPKPCARAGNLSFYLMEECIKFKKENKR